jgi:hypothetical protein
MLFDPWIRIQDGKKSEFGINISDIVAESFVTIFR